MVGAFEYRGHLIGTMRAVPLGLGLAPCEAVLASDTSWAAARTAGDWEIGRLVLAPEYRGGHEGLRRCMEMAFLYLVANADFRNGYALCAPALVRLYRRFGYSLLRKDAVGAGGESFSLIHGAVPAVLAALASQPMAPARDPG